MAYKAIVKCITDDESIKEAWTYDGNLTKLENAEAILGSTKLNEYVSMFNEARNNYTIGQDYQIVWDDGGIDEDPYLICYLRTMELFDKFRVMVTRFEEVTGPTEIPDSEMDGVIAQVQQQEEIALKPLSDED